MIDNGSWRLKMVVVDMDDDKHLKCPKVATEQWNSLQLINSSNGVIVFGLHRFVTAPLANQYPYWPTSIWQYP